MEASLLSSMKGTLGVENDCALESSTLVQLVCAGLRRRLTKIAAPMRLADLNTGRGGDV